MRTPRLGAVLICLGFFLSASPVALATVNHGDFLGTSVDFLAVSETTTSAGDAEPLWDAPTLSGDQLLFSPTAFISSCTGGTSDTTGSELSTTISAHPGGHIDSLMLVENGDVTLTHFPPLGTAGTNASAAATGNVTVTETTAGSITPVVIPFTGTFAPSSSFSLPANFGTNLWSGSISVDVASVVPNATVAILTLDNDLASTCEAGNTTVKIQKKQVSGPSVAIVVNPIACALEVDKTCCMTQPVLPDFDVCEGELERLVLEYTGDKCSNASCDQGGAFLCLGHRKVGEPADVDVLYSSTAQVSPSSGVSYGDTVELTSSSGTLGEKTTLKVSDAWSLRQILKIDTSCERAIKCGEQLGAFKVVGAESTLGGVVDCNGPPPEPQCVPDGYPAGTGCDDAVVDMVFEYQGQACQNPLPNPQGGYASCSGDATGDLNVGLVYTGPFGYAEKISPASGINDGDRIRVSSTFKKGGLSALQSFKIVDKWHVLQTISMKVSCQQPFALGDQFGSLKLVEFTTKSGFHAALGAGPGPFDSCKVPLAPPGPHCTSPLRSLTLRYVGNSLGTGCTVTGGASAYGSCSGVDDPGNLVSASTSSGLTADPSSLIEIGDLVTITPASGDLPAQTSVTATGDGGSQTVQITTSCAKPLSLGDRFGGFVVFGMDREEEGPITLGGNVQYQYHVTNPTAYTVDNIEVSDDQLGVIASGVSLPAGGEQTFKKDATVEDTTTNVATVTGDVLGSICDAGTDSATVTVVPPPKGPFSCNGSIHELKLRWSGAQTVNLKVWKGSIGGTLLAGYQNLHPGDAIKVGGFGNTYPTFELLDSWGRRIGKSTFDLWCNDSSMNGVEDCGKYNGNLQYNDATLDNDWQIEGMTDSNESFECTPGLGTKSPSPSCGFGPELLLVMPGLMWLHRRRLRKGKSA